ncbi:MAG: RIP metalloprotease RseP [Candidatus Dormibacteria bacterium]
MTGFLFGLLVFIVVIFAVIIVHELGHFTVAKLSGIRVDEFSFGFGWRIASRKKGETEYSLRAIPAGGYVRMAGMLGLEGEADAGPRNFYRAAWWKRALTILAGILSNFIFAGILFTIVFAIPVDSVLPSGEPLAKAGFHSGDVVVDAGGIAVPSTSITAAADAIHKATIRSEGHPLVIVMQTSSGKIIRKVVTPELVLYVGVSQSKSSPLQKGGAYIIDTVNGVPVPRGLPEVVLGNGSPVTVTLHVEGATGKNAVEHTVSIAHVHDAGNTPLVAGEYRAAWRIGYEAPLPGEPLVQSVRDGFLAVPQYISASMGQLWHLITSNPGGLNGPNGLSGPVGIAIMGAQQAKAGWVSFLEFVAIISTSVGLMNVLPVPFLDGGKFLLLVVEGVRRKRMQPEREAIITTIGLALLLILAFYVTIGDIEKIPLFLKGS